MPNKRKSRAVKKLLKQDPADRSSWDTDIDLTKLSTKERARLFPSEYDRDGNPYGDF